jgi:transposase
MSKIKEVLRLKYHNQLSNRQIALVTDVSRNSVANYLKEYEQIAIPLDTVLAMNNQELEQLFYPKKFPLSDKKSELQHPNWSYIKEELSKKGMTRALLYEECKNVQPNLYSYSQFNRNYNKFLKSINPSMRQLHYNGDKLFIDYSGLTMPIVNAKTGEITKAQIFVSVLGASGYTFVHATPTQTTKDFIASHVLAFQFYEGVPNILVPDNLKAAVISNKKGKVKLNESYKDMARHYGVAIQPARPYKPQDKSKVELGVKAIQRWILAKLRHITFFSVDELNEKISELLDEYNNKVIRRLGKSRTQLFELLDKPSLHKLKANNYVYKEFKTATVGVDYHIELNGSGYSVPFKYLGKKVDVAYCDRSVVISIAQEVIAHHPRVLQPYEDSTIKEHMPKQHEYQYEKWNPRRILSWANAIGVNATALVQRIIDSRTHQVRGYKSCMAILSFSKTYGTNELEMVCTVANELNIYKVASIESMLKTKRYRLHHIFQSANNESLNNHTNIRGSQYYSNMEDSVTKEAMV